MTDRKSYADRLGKYLGDWSQDADDKAFVDEARSLELLVKMRPMKDAGQEEEINKLKAELNQCLTAHAILNDKVCALEQAIQNTLDTGMDRYIREVIEK